MKDELRNSSNFVEPKRNKSALRENTEFVNKSNVKNFEELGIVKNLNYKLTEELKKNVEIVEVLQRRCVDMNRKIGELCSFKAQYEEEIENLTDGLSQITNFVFSIPCVKVNPEEHSIIDSTIKAISVLYENTKKIRN